MRTLYIDVYFLINFTVDTVALYFASSFSFVPTSKRRILLAAILGALFAVVDVLFFNNPIPELIFSAITLVFVSFIASGKVSLVRKIKMTVSFIIFSALIGGGVNYLWGIFDKYISGKIGELGTGQQTNRRLIIIAIVIFASIGVFKLMVAFFGKNNSAGGTVNIDIVYFNKTVSVEAFIDTGNLALDPMDASPIVFLKSEIAKKILPREMIDLHDPDLLSPKDRKRIRLIPISKDGRTGVITGFKPDAVEVKNNKNGARIRATVAIDKEGGSYGGYYALLSASALDNVIS